MAGPGSGVNIPSPLGVLHTLFGTNDNKEMLKKAERAVMWAGAARTISLVAGSAFALGAVASLSPMVTMVGIVTGLAMITLGHTMHELMTPINIGLDVVRFVQEDDRATPLLLSMKASYDIACRRCFVPLPRLENLPQVGAMIQELYLPNFSKEQLDAYAHPTKIRIPNSLGIDIPEGWSLRSPFKPPFPLGVVNVSNNNNDHEVFEF